MLLEIQDLALQCDMLENVKGLVFLTHDDKVSVFLIMRSVRQQWPNNLFDECYFNKLEVKDMQCRASIQANRAIECHR